MQQGGQNGVALLEAGGISGHGAQLAQSVRHQPDQQAGAVVVPFLHVGAQFAVDADDQVIPGRTKNRQILRFRTSMASHWWRNYCANSHFFLLNFQKNTTGLK